MKLELESRQIRENTRGRLQDRAKRTKGLFEGTTEQRTLVGYTPDVEVGVRKKSGEEDRRMAAG